MLHHTRIKVFIALAAFTLLVRLPFFFPDAFSSDEATFILIGQDILDGNLLYDKLWDVKPPLLFYSFAGFIYVLGKSVPAVRLGGALFVFLGACFAYLLGERLKSSRTGIIAALLYVLFTTLSLSGGSVTSEMIAVAPLAAAAFVLLKDDLGPKDLFLAGILMSAACLVRLNLVYVAIPAGFFILGGKIFRSTAGAARRFTAYAAGGVLPVAVFFLPYLFAGKVGLFFNVMYKAPLMYSTSQYGALEAIRVFAARMTERECFPTNILILGGVACGLAFIAFSRRRFSAQTGRCLAAVLFFLASTFLSVILSGAAHVHYLIQVLPFAALIAAIFLDWAAGTRGRPVVIAATALCLVLPARTVLNAYKPVVARAIAGKSLTYGPIYELADYLKKNNPENEPVYFMTGHLAQWFLGIKPLSRVSIHPSSIAREYELKAAYGPSATVKSELAGILDQDPVFIIKPARLTFLNGYPEALSLLSEKLLMDYELVHVIGDFFIYRRQDYRPDSVVSTQNPPAPGSRHHGPK